MIMDLQKIQSKQVISYIRHNLRDLPENKLSSNESIDPSLTKQNYSLVNRGKTAKEVNDYRLNLEREIFKYNRKNLVHAISLIIQCPTDCPDEQKDDFFRESFNYICSTLPMGEKCVFVAEIHKDEKHYTPDGTMISKDHLHIMYTPAVPDTKHKNFRYKLCANQLTRKSELRKLHPGLQNHLNNAGIHATVYKQKTNDGNTISLSVYQLKTLTKNTGIVIDKPITIDELTKILVENVKLKEKNKELEQEITNIQTEISLENSSNNWGNNINFNGSDSLKHEWEDEKEW
mgnify:CR=1 FL=1